MKPGRMVTFEIDAKWPGDSDARPINFLRKAIKVLWRLFGARCLGCRIVEIPEPIPVPVACPNTTSSRRKRGSK